jgi:hypothetical protein
MQAAVIAFILGFIASYFSQWPTPPRILWYRYRLRKMRERPCYTFPKGIVFIIPAITSTEGVSGYVSQNAMVCVHTVSRMLKTAGLEEGRDFEILFQFPTSDRVPDDVRTQNLILICGPKRNRLVETIIHDFPSLLHSVRLDLTGEPAFVYQGQKLTSDSTRDFALMAVKQNPYNPKKRLVLLFGLHGIGTKGAGSFYASPGWTAMRSHAAQVFETHSGEIEVLLCVEHTDDRQTVKSVVPFDLANRAASVLRT